MKTLLQPRLLILLLIQVWVVPSLACNQNQYWQDMKCCDKCPSGKKLVSKCAAESDTQCEDCPSGEFQDTWSVEKNCNPFSYCDPNAGFLQRSAGTAEKDAVCECAPGAHCSSAQCETCVRHTPCRPGSGVVTEANNLVDTKCELCPSGTFSNETSLTERCHRWTSCEGGSQEVKKMGSSSSDVTCGPKAEGSGSLRPAFLSVGIVVGIIVVFILSGMLYVCRDKVPCLRNFNPVKKIQLENLEEQMQGQQEQKVPNIPEEEDLFIPEDKPTQTAEEADETRIGFGSPVQESAAIQEVGKESHLPQQEVL